MTEIKDFILKEKSEGNGQKADTESMDAPDTDAKDQKTARPESVAGEFRLPAINFATFIFYFNHFKPPFISIIVSNFIFNK